MSLSQSSLFNASLLVHALGGVGYLEAVGRRGDLCCYNLQDAACCTVEAECGEKAMHLDVCL